MVTERWVTSPRDGNYEVSSLGRVRSIPRARTKGGVLKPWLNSRGYPVVKISGPANKRTRALVHVLVAEAFLGPRPDGLETMHLDDDRTNARLDNLAYGTPSENNLHKVAAGRDRNASKTQCINGHPFTPENTRFRKDRPSNRDCRACGRERSSARRARERAERDQGH